MSCRGVRFVLAIPLLAGACSVDTPQIASLPANAFAFGVFGDGPYRRWEYGRFNAVVADVNRAELKWLIHVGDILWYPCSDELFANRRSALTAIRHPVVYTPGDNEWTDCHEAIAGGFQPLERLAALRRVFFSDSALHTAPLNTTSQSADRRFPEFVENVRWHYGRFVFATIHVVGSDNGAELFPGRSSADDREVERRTEAALVWMQEAFDSARSGHAKGIVIAMHADPDFESPPGDRRAFRPLIERLEQLVRAFPGEVVLIHGDSHEFRVDHPLIDQRTGQPLANFTRLETFGSPDIGWVRVVVDSVRGILEYESRLMPRWRF